MNFGIIEDEILYMDTLKKQIKFWCHQKKSIGCNILWVQSENEFEQKLDDLLECKILFFDIQLADSDKNLGLILAEKIREKGFDGNIIFVTNYDRFAVQSFSSMPVGFLVKPVRDIQIFTLLNKLWNKMKEPEFFVFLENKTERQIPLSIICYFEAVKHKIRFCTIINKLNENERRKLTHADRINGKSFLNYKPEYFCSGSIQEILKEIEDIPNFIQSRRNYILNVNHILVMPDKYAEIANGDKLAVGTRFRNEVRDCYLGSEKFVGRKKIR